MSDTLTGWLAQQTRHTRAVIVLFAAAAFMVLLAGIAWACVPYHGEVSVYPVNQGEQAVNHFAQGEQAVTVHGGNGQIIDGERFTGMRWCTGDGDEAEPYEAGAIRPSSDSPDLKLVVEDRTSGCVGESEALPTGEYFVAVNNNGFSEDNADFGEQVEFDKNAVTGLAYDEGCFWHAGEDQDEQDFDYVHPEPLMVHEDGGSLMIDDLTGVMPSSETGKDSVAAICILEDDTFRSNIVPFEILSEDSHSRSNGRGNGS